MESNYGCERCVYQNIPLQMGDLVSGTDLGAAVNDVDYTNINWPCTVVLATLDRCDGEETRSEIIAWLIAYRESWIDERLADQIIAICRNISCVRFNVFLACDQSSAKLA